MNQAKNPEGPQTVGGDGLGAADAPDFSGDALRLEALERMVAAQHEQVGELTELCGALTRRSHEQAAEMEKYKAQTKKLGDAFAGSIRMLEKRINDLRDSVKSLERGF